MKDSLIRQLFTLIFHILFINLSLQTIKIQQPSTWEHSQSKKYFKKKDYDNLQFNGIYQHGIKLDQEYSLFSFYAMDNHQNYLFLNVMKYDGGKKKVEKILCDNFGSVKFSLTGQSNEFVYLISHPDQGFLSYGFMDFELKYTSKGQGTINISDPLFKILNMQLACNSQYLYTLYALYDQTTKYEKLELKILELSSGFLGTVVDQILISDSQNLQTIEISQFFTLQAYSDNTAQILILESVNSIYYHYLINSAGEIQVPVAQQYGVQFMITENQDRNHITPSLKLQNSEISTVIFIKTKNIFTVLNYNKEGTFGCIKDHLINENEYNLFHSSYGLISNDYIFFQIEKIGTNNQADIFLLNPQSCEFYPNSWNGIMEDKQLSSLSLTFPFFTKDYELTLNNIIQYIDDNNQKIYLNQMKISEKFYQFSDCGPYQVKSGNSCVCIGDQNQSYSRQISKDCICPLGYISNYDSDDNCQALDLSCEDVQYQIQYIWTDTIKITLEEIVLLPYFNGDYNKQSNLLCLYLFPSTQLSKFGPKPKCNIIQDETNQQTQIFVQFTDYEVLYNINEQIDLAPNIFNHQRCPKCIIIKNYSNIQILTPYQIETYPYTEVYLKQKFIFSLYEDIHIGIEKIKNDGFKNLNGISWQLSQTFPAIITSKLTEINNNLSTNFLNEKYFNLTVGTLEYNTIYQFSLSYQNFLGQQFTQLFNVSIQYDVPEIQMNQKVHHIQPNIYYEIPITILSKQFSSSSDYKISTPNFNYTFAQKTQNSQNYNQIISQGQSEKNNEGLVDFIIFPYQFQSNQSHDIQLKVQIQNVDKINTIYTYFTIIVDALENLAYIVGGSRMASSGYQLEIQGYYSDPNVKEPFNYDNFTLFWECLNLQTNEQCQDQDGNTILLQQDIDTFIIPANTFKPYSILRFSFTALKNNINKTDTVLINMIEDDSPSPVVKLQDEVLTQQINTNDLIYIESNYEPKSYQNEMIYQLVLIYEGQKVAIKNFQYKDFCFRVWDIFNDFQNDNYQINAKIILYDPNYSIQSVSNYLLHINQPPQSGLLQITPSIGQALDTEFTISALDFIDNNSQKTELTYQFSYFVNPKDFDIQKKLGPTSTNSTEQILQYFSQKNKIQSILPRPQSINKENYEILILVQIKDKYQAITNVTKTITVQYSNNHYNQLSNIKNQYDILIQNDSEIQKLNKWQKINKLCVLSEELFQSYNELSGYPEYNSILEKVFKLLTKLKQQLQHKGHKSQATKQLFKLIKLMNKQNLYNKYDLDFILQELSNSISVQENSLYNFKQMNTLDRYDPLINAKKVENINIISNYLFQIDIILESMILQEKFIKQNVIITLMHKISHIYDNYIMPNSISINYVGEIIQYQFQRLNFYQMQVSDIFYYNDDIQNQNNDDNNRRVLLENQDNSTNFNKIYGIQFNKFSQNFIYNENFPYNDQNNQVQQYYIFQQNEDDYSINLNNMTLYSFLNYPKSKKTVCLQNENGKNWDNKNCQTIFEQNGNTYCQCQSKGFIAVFEDIDNIFLDSVDLIGDSMNNESLQSMSGFEYYKCILIYLVVFLLGLQILLQKIGYEKDKSEKMEKLKIEYNQQKFDQNTHIQEKASDSFDWEKQEKNLSQNICQKLTQKRSQVIPLHLLDTFSDFTQIDKDNQLTPFETEKNIQQSVLIKRNRNLRISNFRKCNKNNFDLNSSADKNIQNNHQNEEKYQQNNSAEFKDQKSRYSDEKQDSIIDSNKDLSQTPKSLNHANKTKNFKQINKTQSFNKTIDDISGFPKNLNNKMPEILNLSSFYTNKKQIQANPSQNNLQDSQNEQIHSFQESAKNETTMYNRLDTISLFSQSFKKNEAKKSQSTESKILNKLEKQQIKKIMKQKQDLYSTFMLFHQFLSIQLIYMPKCSRNVRYMIYFLKQYQAIAFIQYFENQNYSDLQALVFSIITILFTGFPQFILKKLFKKKNKVIKFISYLLFCLIFISSFWLILVAAPKYGVSASNRQSISYLSGFLFDFTITQALNAYLKQKLIKKFGLKNRIIRFFIPKQVRLYFKEQIQLNQQK